MEEDGTLFAPYSSGVDNLPSTVVYSWRPIQSTPARRAPLEEAEEERPHHLVLTERFFIVCHRRRRTSRIGALPWELAGRRLVRARVWQRYQALKRQEPSWEKALGYRARMEREGLSIRDLARVLGLHHSGVARTLEILKLPDGLLEALRRHGADTRVRAHFTEKRLRAAMAEPCPQDLLAEIEAVLRGSRTLAIPVPRPSVISGHGRDAVRAAVPPSVFPARRPAS